MHLSRFVDENPDVEVGRPDVMTPALIAAAAGLGSALALAGAWYSLATDAAGALVIWALLGLGLGVVTVRAGLAAGSLWGRIRKGQSSWALSESELLLIDADGTALRLALDRVLDVSLREGEVHLRTDGEVQGLVYSVLFRLFDDEEGPCPDPERFYVAVSARLGRPVAEVHSLVPPAQAA